MALVMSFDTVIRPYFTPCYRVHMIHGNLDLWDYDKVKQEWQAIHDVVQSKKMPRAGCAEGVWCYIDEILFESLPGSLTDEWCGVLGATA